MPTPDVDLDGDVDLDVVTAELLAVETALERLDAGTYGTCESCGAPLDDEVLAVDPLAAACPDHRRV